MHKQSSRDAIEKHNFYGTCN